MVLGLHFIDIYLKIFDLFSEENHQNSLTENLPNIFRIVLPKAWGKIINVWAKFWVSSHYFLRTLGLRLCSQGVADFEIEALICSPCSWSLEHYIQNLLEAMVNSFSITLAFHFGLSSATREVVPSNLECGRYVAGLTKAREPSMLCTQSCTR